LPCGQDYIHEQWLEVAGRHGYRTSPREAEMVRVDAGRNLGFTRVVARRRAD
jgi:hypothetical protein